ncbi:hypothetical protein [Bradyrhizobium sp. USDA 3458]|uniref:phage adaptor protein n=1 Tax=Bradyrhizobium sp. USDA 3458 TaxID=2591461 RepID=UPI001141E6DA|nr:hypothetical protein [Bradyrhizobium sp. USDA 3458]
MTILSACDQASKLMGKGAMTSLFANTDPFAGELAALSNDVAPDIAKRYDWQKLITLNSQVGDGTATAFDLPANYDRMPVKANVWLSSTSLPMEHVTDLDDWRQRRLLSLSSLGGEWTIIGGQMQIFPAMTASQTATFYYVSNQIVSKSGGSTDAAFSADTDSFRLPERLMSLALIWRWRQMKRFDYAEDMETFEIALAQEIARDKGSKIIRVGVARTPDWTVPTYPGTITP